METHRDLMLRYKIHVACWPALHEYREIILSDTSVTTVTAGQSTKLPQLISRLRTEDFVIMVMNNSTIQVNFIKEHKKVIIWAEDGRDLHATIIFDVGAETRAQTLSLSQGWSSQELTGEMRSLLSKTREKVKELMQ